jgi:hypothetical protein
MLPASLIAKLPKRVADTVDRYAEILDVFRAIHDPRVARSLGPPGVRGLLFQRGKQGAPTLFPASHRAYFDWTYPSDHPDMARALRARQGRPVERATLPAVAHLGGSREPRGAAPARDASSTSELADGMGSTPARASGFLRRHPRAGCCRSSSTASRAR